ncbi:hypothetical protein BDV93DRAFT_358970 [Ceratobasidium sp. AG-I]|nr:hypothetical protein BDV93DRAFT_358970 [Ceratobasidium sp. AG-I]
MRFSKLHTVLLDTHNDFAVAPPSSVNQSPRSLGHYRLLAPRLPPSLRRLFITNAHGPDIAVIQMLKSCCPNLTELSISRCTMFSPCFRPDSSGTVMGCRFWDRFAADHDSYFAGEGIEEYACSLAHELKPLSSLETLHMGLYLTPHEAISEHLHQHDRLKDPTGTSWSSPCETCTNRFKSRTQLAEAGANEVLFGGIPSLREISWASFFSDGRLGAIRYMKDSASSSLGQCRQ